MRKHALKHLRGDDDSGGGGEQPISNKSCQTDILGLDKYLQRSPPEDANQNDRSAVASAAPLRTYRKPSKRPKVRSVAVHCERRRLSFAAFKGCQKFKHVYKRKISLPQPSDMAASASVAAVTATSSSSSSSAAKSDGRWERGVLPKLRPDRTETVAAERPTATKPAGPAVKLPRIPIRDMRPEPDRPEDSHRTRLAKLRSTRPWSTGSGSGDGSDGKKLAYFRASSAPRIDSGYRFGPVAAAPPPDRGQLQSTAESGDSADTTLDVSFVVHSNATATNGQTPAAASTSATRNASTSTTFPAEPIFPIVFSCESVLRHPLDGGYVSHTESHRFSVHYVPVESADPTTTTTTADSSDDKSRSSLVFSSAAACQNDRRCLTGDTVSVTVGKPYDSTASPGTASSTATSSSSSSSSSSTTNTVGERRVVVERPDANVPMVEDAAAEEPSSLSSSSSDGHVERNGHTAKTDDNALENQAEPVRMAGVYVLGKGDPPVNQRRQADVSEENAEQPTSTDKSSSSVAFKETVSDGGDGEEGGVVKSHALTDMPLQSDERNYERLTQKHVDSNRTVSNQSPKFDSTETRLLGGKNDSEPVGDDVVHANESDSSCTSDEPTKQFADSNDRRDESYLKQNADNPIGESEVVNTTMASQYRWSGKQHHEPIGKRRTECNRSDAGENVHRLTHPNFATIHSESTDKRHFDNKRDLRPRADRERDDDRYRQYADRNQYHTAYLEKPTRLNSINQLYDESTSKRENEIDRKNNGPINANNNDTHEFGSYNTGKHGSRQQINPNARVEEANTSCRRCTNSLHKNNEKINEVKHNSSVKAGQSKDYNYKHLYDKGEIQYPKRRLESVDESNETKESNYVGGFLFGDSYYKKQPQKFDPDNDHDGYSKYDYYNDSKKVNFSSKPTEHYNYYQDYVQKTRHSPRDEDCTVFAAGVPRKTVNKGVQHDRYTADGQTQYYSQLAKGYGDDKNTDSDGSLTDSLEDGKFEGTAISYFLSLNGQKSAVTFTLKMPNTLESRLNRRQSLLKKHLHMSTTVRKPTMRVRARHKGCQTLWTEEKGVQVQRGSTANARKPVVDDRKVLETLLAGLNRSRVSENQIRVVGGRKMVSEGNQTEEPHDPPTNRQTQTTRDAAAGPETSLTNTVATTTSGAMQNKTQTMKKFSADNALMVGVVRQNKYKGKEALEGAKNDQLLTLSKGWINFYTLRDDSVDAETQGNNFTL